MRNLMNGLALAGTLALVGCGAPAAEDQAAEHPWTRTIVTIAADGTQTSKIVPVDAALNAKELSLRAKLADGTLKAPLVEGVLAVAGIVRDNSCVGSSVWIWDGPNNTGNQICFYKSGPENYAMTDLGLWRRTVIGTKTLYWWYNARSIYSGVDWALLQRSTSSGDLADVVAPWTNRVDSPAYGTARYLGLCTNCP
jgi:hypothetical protein